MQNMQKNIKYALYCKFLGNMQNMQKLISVNRLQITSFVRIPKSLVVISKLFDMQISYNPLSSNDLPKYAKRTVATLTSKENWFG
jgi:hypothetical protein